jgi:putative transposase
MRTYIRAYQPGGCYFFTVVTNNRIPHFAEQYHIDRLRLGFRHVMVKRPFAIDAIVVMPDHIHVLWRLPEADHDFSTRWRLIKHFVSRGWQGDDAFWQPRFWEHLIRDEDDWQNHVDYIHYNPVKHGMVTRPEDWAFGSYRKARADGWYPDGWGSCEPESCKNMEIE